MDQASLLLNKQLKGAACLSRDVVMLTVQN